MRILFIGDIFGRPGRQKVQEWLPDYRERRGVDFVAANAENSAGGKGINAEIAEEFFESGIDALTGGNHSFQYRDSYPLFERDERVLRPANLPPGTPGRGLGIYQLAHGPCVAVANLQGRAFMKPVDCPFRAAERLLEEAQAAPPIVIIDFHAEASSEKVAMAAHVDGRATAVIGTHTHVPTADARVSPAGTAAITDVGMTGPCDSVIGVRTDIILEQLIVGMPVRHEVGEGPARVCALEMDVDESDGRAQSVRLVQDPDWPRRRGQQAKSR